MNQINKHNFILKVLVVIGFKFTLKTKNFLTGITNSNELNNFSSIYTKILYGKQGSLILVLLISAS